VSFVRELYENQVRQHADRTEPDNAAFYSLFTRETRELMQAPRTNPGKEPIGKILHAFFGFGVLPGTDVRLARVMPAFGGTGGLFLVRVDLIVHGDPRQILVRPVREDGVWRVADIFYGGNESLAGYYRGITGH